MTRKTVLSWSEGEDALVTKLWLDGLTTRQIGKRMFKTHSAVGGRVHRLGLPGRPSPIRSQQTPGQVQAAAIALRAPKETLMQSLGSKPVLALPLRAVLPARRSGPRCCWPMNNGRPLWLFCSSMAIGEKPYCLAHCKVAYVAVGEKRGDGI